MRGVRSCCEEELMLISVESVSKPDVTDHAAASQSEGTNMSLRGIKLTQGPYNTRTKKRKTDQISKFPLENYPQSRMYAHVAFILAMSTFLLPFADCRIKGKSDHETLGVLLLDAITFPKVVPHPLHAVVVLVKKQQLPSCNLLTLSYLGLQQRRNRTVCYRFHTRGLFLFCRYVVFVAYLCLFCV